MKSQLIYDINKKFIVTILKNIKYSPNDIVFEFKNFYLSIDVNKEREQASFVITDKEGKEIISFFKHYMKYTAYSNCMPIEDFLSDHTINEALKDFIFDGGKVIKYLYGGGPGYRIITRELCLLLNEHAKAITKDNFSYIL